MLILEFAFVFIATLLLLFEMLLISKSVFHSPIYEIKVFFFGMLLIAIGLIFYALEAIYSNANQPLIAEIQAYDRLGYFFTMIGLLFIGYAFVLPNFSATYPNIFLICLLSILGSSSAFINGMTSTIIINGEFLKTMHNSVGLILNYLFILVIFYVIAYRLIEISKISKKISTTQKSNKFLMICLILFFFSFLVSVLTNVVFSKQYLPNNFYYLFISLSFVFFIYFYLKDKAFFFLTPIIFDALIIMHKKSGLTIYSESYKENFIVEDMLSGVFSLLNVSLKEYILSKQELEEVVFADKMAIIVPGKVISSILIVSGKNLIIESLAKATTTNFEKEFYQELMNNHDDSIFDRKKFSNFSKYTSEIRRYIPL